MFVVAVMAQKSDKGMGLSENSVPLHPMVNDHYPYEKWLFHWGFGPHFQTYSNMYSFKDWPRVLSPQNPL